MKATRVTALMVGLGCLAMAAMVGAQGDTTKGTVALESKSIAAGIGVTWGDGNLSYRGQVYPFTVKGLSVVDVGIAKVSARGDVDDLKTLKDFEGTYTLVKSGAAVAGGAGAAALQNQNGVKMTLVGTGQGVKFALAAGGMDVKLKQ
jgi:hypothetical protein